MSLTYLLSFFSITFTALRANFSACRNANGVGKLLVTVLVRSSSPVLITLYVVMHRMAQPFRSKQGLPFFKNNSP